MTTVLVLSQPKNNETQELEKGHLFWSVWAWFPKSWNSIFLHEIYHEIHILHLMLSLCCPPYPYPILTLGPPTQCFLIYECFTLKNVNPNHVLWLIPGASNGLQMKVPKRQKGGIIYSTVFQLFHIRGGGYISAHVPCDAVCIKFLQYQQ